MTERTKRANTINLVKTETGYDAINRVGVTQGHIYKLDDGFYHFEMTGSGVWSSNGLHLMGSVLEDLNADWQKDVERGIK